MNVLDWALVVVILAYAISGYWQGFITGAFATVGLVLGGLAGIWVAPRILGRFEPSLMVSIGALCVVLILASVGQAVLQHLGSRVRARVTWRPARAVDAVGGSALSVVAALVVCWMLGVAISGSQLPGVGPQVRSSRVLHEVNAVIPTSARQALNGFNDLVSSSSFPRYLEPFAQERIVRVAKAPKSVVRDPEIEAASNSIMKIRGNNICGQGVEGTGFLYSPRRIMTNAHVVAGVRNPKVLIDGSPVSATVVYYDPRVDVAVLALAEDAAVPPLAFDTRAQPKDVGVVAGFPNDGPYETYPARIRSEQRLRSPDIYGRGSIIRTVYAIRGRVSPGNSGGPLVGTNGRVYGVVFAASVSDASTGYVLTANQVADAAVAGISRNSAVSTRGCA